MALGGLPVSLDVKDIEASRAFHEKLGFAVFTGDPAQSLILKNGDHAVGLFQGMFERNALAFSPVWDSSAQELASLTDVSELHRGLRMKGGRMQQEDDEATLGPASFMVVDPDGNPIRVYQHV